MNYRYTFNISINSHSKWAVGRLVFNFLAVERLEIKNKSSDGPVTVTIVLTGLCNNFSNVQARFIRKLIDMKMLSF